MPRGDGTGPMGIGPLAGRGAGFCTGNRMPGYLNQSIWRGSSFFVGRGYRRMFCITGFVSGCAYFAYRFANRKGKGK